MPFQTFDTADVVRLEIERDPDEAEQLNLIPNPDGSGGEAPQTSRRGGWGWLSQVADSFISWAWFTSPTSTKLRYTTAIDLDNYFQTDRSLIPFGSTHCAATWTHDTAHDSLYASGEFLFYDLAGAQISSSQPSPWNNGALGAAGLADVPTDAVYVSLRIYVANDAHGARFSTWSDYDFKDATLLTWSSDPGLAATSSTNLLANGSFDTGISGWTATGATITSSAIATPHQGENCMRLALTATPAYVNTSAASSTTVGETYTFSIKARVGSVATRARAWVEFYNASSVLVGARIYGTLLTTDTSWQTIRVTATAPVGSTKVRCGIESRDSASGTSYFDSALLEEASQANPWFLGTRSTPTAALPATPNRYWQDVTSETGSIALTRLVGDVGTLDAEILSNELDPASGSTLLRPGKQVRLSVLASGSWESVYRGRLQGALTQYELLNRAENRCRIKINAVDAFAILAAAKITSGIGRIYYLPGRLEGLGVPWHTDGTRSHSLSSAANYIADTTVLDNVFVARDEQNGWAWTDRHGVVCVFPRDDWTAYDPPPITLTEDDYNGDIAVSHDSSDLINSITVSVLGPGTTQVDYGPYEDGVSVIKWGRRTATFTVAPWIVALFDPAAYAANVLASNTEPQVSIDSVTVPLHTTERIDAFATTDLLQEVNLSNAELGYSQALRVQSVSHQISAGKRRTGGKWLMTLTFTHADRAPIPTTGA